MGDHVIEIEKGAFILCDRLTTVYYKGTEKEWNTLSNSIGTYNDKLINATIYYYSSTQPTTSGNYWHYDEYGNIATW